MRITYKAIICAAALSTVLASCYEDEGNYDYDDSIADIEVDIEDLYGVRKADTEMTYTITPTVTTVDGDKSYLKYTWLMNTSSANSSRNDTIGHDEAVTLKIDPNSADFSYNYYLKLYVENTLTNTVTMVATQLQVTKPYSKAWAVLYDEGDHADVGTVEYVGSDMMVMPHAFSDDSGTTLTGKAVNLSVVQSTTKSRYYFPYDADSQFFIATTNPEESGLYSQADKFTLIANYPSLVSVSQADNVDFKDFTTASCNNNGLMVCSKGNVFNSSYYSPFMFMMKPDETLTGDCYISKICAGPHTAIGYDKAGHRFVHLALQSAGDSWSGFNVSGEKDAGPVKRIPYRTGLDSRDPNRIDESEEIINFVNGYHYEISGVAIWQRYSCYAYALSSSGSMSHVYVFRYYALTHNDVATLHSDYEFVTPDGITANTPMASGASYNNILFYAVGNKVYKLDVTSGNSTLIYQHEDSKAEITCMKMAMNGYGWSDSSDSMGEDDYGHPYCRLLGVGVNKSDGTGDLVVLQLNTAGKVDEDHKYPSTQVHKGFGKIKDIAFI